MTPEQQIAAMLTDAYHVTRLRRAGDSARGGLYVEQLACLLCGDAYVVRLELAAGVETCADHLVRVVEAFVGLHGGCPWGR